MRLVVGIPEPHVTREVLEPAAEAVTRLDEQLIERGQVPTFHDALNQGMMKWRPEAPGDERFDHARTVIERGHGDCDDLAPWRAASARATGEDPGARAVMVKKSPTLWHCVVQMSDGRIEDPSKEAGMDQYKRNAGTSAAAVPIMQRAAVVGGVKRPSLAIRPVRVRGQTIGWQARVDLPQTSTEAALVQLHYAPVASQAIVGACNAAGEIAEASGTIIDPDTIAPVDAIAGLLTVRDPHLVSKVCGTGAVERAEQWLDMAERECGPLHHVGLFGIHVPIVDDAIHAVQAVGHVVSNVVHAVDSVTHVITPVVSLFGHVLNAAEGVISLVPGIGPGIDAAISAGIALLSGGSPLEIAIRAAYGAIPIPPGLRELTDIVLNAVLDLALHGADPSQAAINIARNKVPSGLPRDVFDTLVHLVVHAAKGGAPTRAIASPKPGGFPGMPVALNMIPVLHLAGGQKVLVKPPSPPHPRAMAKFPSTPLRMAPRGVRPGFSMPTIEARPFFMQGLPGHLRWYPPAGIAPA